MTRVRAGGVSSGPVSLTLGIYSLFFVIYQPLCLFQMAEAVAHPGPGVHGQEDHPGCSY